MIGLIVLRYFLGKDAKRLPALRRMPRIVSA